MKKCIVCDKDRELSEFYTCGSQNQWLRGECKTCCSIASKVKNYNTRDNYKVYLIKNRVDNEIIYVGCTSQTLNKRFNGHAGDKKFDPAKVYISLVQENLTEVEGFKLEAMLIEQYKTTENHYKGYKIHDKYTKKFVKKTDAWTEAIKKAHNRPIICLNDGKVYSSLGEAASKLNLSVSKICSVCQGKRPHTKGYRFSYL